MILLRNRLCFRFASLFISTRGVVFIKFPLLFVFLILITFSAEKFIYHFQSLYCPVSKLLCFTPKFLWTCSWSYFCLDSINSFLSKYLMSIQPIKCFLISISILFTKIFLVLIISRNCYYFMT